MRLTVLGGASAGPNAGQGCSGYLVDSGATRVVLDLGPGTLPELRRHADFRMLDGVVLSHLHIDHCLDLFAHYWALSHNPVRPPGPMPVWMPPGAGNFIDDVLGVLSPAGLAGAPVDRVFSVREFDPDQALTIGDLTLTFYPTSHYVPTWAIRVEDPRSCVLAYTADTGPEADLSELVAGAQVVVAEAMLLDTADYGDGFRGSSTAAEAATLAESADADTLVLAHIHEEWGAEPARRQAEPIFTGRLEIATPGLVVEW